MYKVRQFIINEMNGNGIIQNSKGITIIQNRKVIDFFIDIDKRGILHVSDEVLEEIFSSEYLQVLDFLLQSDLIYELPDSTISLDKLAIYSNNSELKKLISFVKCDDLILVEDIEVLRKHKYVLVFLNRFTLVELYEICDDLRTEGVKFCISFVYNSKIYISNLYYKDWCNPCPKCFFATIESNLRAYAQQQGEISFQTIVDLIYSKESKFEINTPLSMVNLLTFLSEVLKMKYNDYNILATRIKEIDLKGNIKYDVATNFELCDCFEIT